MAPAAPGGRTGGRPRPVVLVGVAACAAAATAGGPAHAGGPRSTAAGPSAALGAPHAAPAPGSGGLRRWLSSLQVRLPNASVSEAGVDFALTGGLCESFALEGLRVSEGVAGVGIEAQGLALACTLHWSAKSHLLPVIHGMGTVTASLANSSIEGLLSWGSDGGAPALPVYISASGCTGAFHVAHLAFSGGALSKSLEALRGLVVLLLTRQLPSVICESVDNLINTVGSEAVRNASLAARRYLAQPAAPPSRLPEPRSDFVDLTRNAGVQFLERLLRTTLGNQSSPRSMAATLARLLGPQGQVSLSGLAALPLNRLIAVRGLGALNVTLSSLSLAGLSTWSELSLGTPAPQELAGSLGIGELSGSAALTLGVLPGDARGPLHGEALTESFDLEFKLHGLGASAAAFLAVDAARLAALSGGQLAHLGCLAGGLYAAVETASALRLSLVEPRLVPKASVSLEGDVDQLLNVLAGRALHDFAAAMEALGNQLLSVTLRDALNAQLRSFLSAPPSCPPAGPTYTSVPLSEGSGAAALAGGGLAAAACAALGLGRRRRWSEPAKERGPAVAVQAAEGEAPPVSAQGAVEGLGAVAQAAGGAAAASGCCLARHAGLPRALRVCLPMLVLTTVLLFISSNSGEGANVRLSITVDGQDVVRLPPLFSFSLVSSVGDMWKGGVYALAMLIAAFSGIWPYGKLALMLLCWFAPPRVLGLPRRQKLLDFLDAYGKWSLVDTFVLVLFMVAFRFELSGLHAASPLVSGFFEEVGSDARFVVFVEATLGFYLFLVATLMSLVLGHAMTACHHHAVRLGERSCGPRGSGPGLGREVFGRGRRRLCDGLRPAGRLRGWAFAHGPTAAVTLSLVFVLLGIFTDTFQFKFLGLAGYVLGAEAAVRPYSLASLGWALPGSSESPDAFGTRSIQVAFLVFAAIITPVYLVVLLCLWTAPLSKRVQRQLLVAAHVLNAWSGLDVFCVSIMASVLEIRQFALFIVGEKCDGLNALMAKTPVADALEGPRTCFDVESQLRPGFYLLAVAALLAFVTGQVTLARCSRALAAGSAARRPALGAAAAAAAGVEEEAALSGGLLLPS